MNKNFNNEQNVDLTKTASYSYELPPELIAQHPEKRRDMSRLLVCGRDGSLSHRHFSDIIEYFVARDVLVINNSKVIPARVFLNPEKGGSPVECLLLRAVADKDVEGGDKFAGKATWECLTRPGKRAKEGCRFTAVNDEGVHAEVVSVSEDGNRTVTFTYGEKTATADGNSAESFFSVLDRIGAMPLPPYITEKPEDSSRYQTVYAKTEGSAAAPTAGLHFTPELLSALREKGVEIVEVLLHVGLGTFRPVKEENIASHLMHSEHYEISGEAALKINDAKAAGRRITAVGTTSMRTLEGAYQACGELRASSGETSIFITPGYDFKVVDRLITNFHLPESTLLMLVCAILGYDRTMNAYKTAVEERYRFFSFGDAMLIE